MFDNFVAALRCPHCSAVSPATSITGMQTHLRGGAAYGAELAAGYSFEQSCLTTEHILDSGYALIALPAAAGPTRLLDVWTCPACETEQWAMIEIVGRSIERIEAVPLNRAALEAANFISDVNADLLAESLAGLSHAELVKQNLSSVEVLRQRLE